MPGCGRRRSARSAVEQLAARLAHNQKVAGSSPARATTKEGHSRMPYANADQRREYQRRWMRERREQWLAENGPCKRCGSSDQLEVDHIDPEQKVSHRIWSWSHERRSAELAKCQVLCIDCHSTKTLAEVQRDLMHGTHQGYGRGCRCDDCRLAHRDHNRRWRARSTVTA